MTEYVSLEFGTDEERVETFRAGFRYTFLQGPDEKYYELMPGVVLELSPEQVREYKSGEKESE